jgi:hypothetical protein
MATLTLRIPTARPLTNLEVDNNFTALNTEKLERDGSIIMTGDLQLGATYGIVFEGTTPDAYETKLVAGDPTADRTVTLPNGTTTLVGLGITNTGDLRINGAIGVNIAASGTAGRIDASNDIVAFSSSDERFKKDVVKIENALDRVQKIRGVFFTWNEETKEHHGYEGVDTGVIAQEVVNVLPEVVTVRDNGFMAVKYEKMIGLLVEAIKELNEKVDRCTCCNK